MLYNIDTSLKVTGLQLSKMTEKTNWPSTVHSVQNGDHAGLEENRKIHGKFGNSYGIERMNLWLAVCDFYILISVSISILFEF